MHCPQCQGEIPPGSQFCGICGHNIVPEGTGQSPSLFDIPISAGPKRIRVVILVALNLAMVGGAFALLRGYMHKRDAAIVATSPSPSETAIVTAPANPTRADAGATKAEGVETANGTQRANPLGKRGVDAGGNTKRNVGNNNPGTPSSGGGGSGKADAGAARSDKPDARAASSGNTSPKVAKTDAGASKAGSGSASDAGTEKPAALTPAEEEKRVRIVASKISRVVSSHQGQLSRCYQNAQKVTTPDNPIEGTVKVHFAIHNDGSAKSVRVANNSTGSPTLANCLVGLVRGWKFPSSRGEALDFEWPFAFQAPK